MFILYCLPLSAQYENNDAVYLKLVKEYTLNPDGSMDFRYQKKMKLQTYRAFSSLYGETFITYNPQEQSLKINEAYTIMADGKKVPIPENAMNEVLPGFCTSAPAYNHLREMVITHTGLERNAIINLDYTIHTNKGYWPALMGSELLAEAEPVQELSIRIKIPINSSNAAYRISGIQHEESHTGHHESNGIPDEPYISTEGQFKIFPWDLKNIAAISPEDFQAPGYGDYPRLIFSSSNNRENLYNGFLTQPAFRYEVNDEMAAAVSTIVANNKDTRDIILKLQDKVVNELRLWPVPLKYTGFKIRTAVETWESNGGTPAEKAVLLITLLKAANIPALPVFVIRSSYFDEKIGTLLDIDDIFVLTELKESGPLFLSVNYINQQNLKFGMPGKKFVILDPGKRPEVKTEEEYTNKLLMKGDFSLNDKKQLSGEVSVTFGNNFNPWLTLLRDKNKSKSFFTGGLSSSDLKEMKIATISQDESFVTFAVQKDKSLKMDTNFLTWTLPCFSNGIDSWDIELLPPDRSTELEIPSQADEIYEISLQIPAGLKLFSPEKRTEISNKAGTFLFDLKKNGDKVHVTRSLKLTEKVIAPELYSSFKSLMDHWNSEQYREAVFTK